MTMAYESFDIRRYLVSNEMYIGRIFQRTGEVFFRRTKGVGSFSHSSLRISSNNLIGTRGKYLFKVDCLGYTLRKKFQLILKDKCRLYTFNCFPTLEP